MMTGEQEAYAKSVSQRFNPSAFCVCRLVPTSYGGFYTHRYFADESAALRCFRDEQKPGFCIAKNGIVYVEAKA